MEIEARGAAKRIEREKALVWWGAMMPRLKKPPTFSEFVRPARVQARQTPEELDAMCAALAAAWGAEMVMH